MGKASKVRQAGKGGAVMKPLSEQDRRVIALHNSGASINDIAGETGLKRPRIKHIVEHIGSIHARGEATLALDPESLEGLRSTGAISCRAYSALANATYKIDVPDLERLSDVAAQGRECVARFPGVGPSVMAELDTLLARFGLTWNPRPRPFAWRTSENKHPLLKLWDKDRELSEQQDQRAQYWSTIVRRVAEMERAVGRAVLRDAPGRDSMEGIVYRLSFLTGYLEGHKGGRTNNMRDVTPETEQDDDEYETAGNLICLPGVKLADIHPEGGQQ
jgi:hypothetical protein